MPRSSLLTVMCAGYFLVLLDVTVVNVALPAIGNALDAGPAGLLLAGGAIGDVHGHRRVILTGAGGVRPGLASGVNNTARQAGGAVGIAIFGAVAGRASNARTFLSGLHLSGVASALLFLVAALSTVLMCSN
jgi:MFS family permease